jgi:hypothetical protein
MITAVRARKRYAPFLDQAGVQPAFLRGLPRGAQIFALPTFIILMGVADFRTLSKPIAAATTTAKTITTTTTISSSSSSSSNNNNNNNNIHLPLLLHHAWRELGRPLALFAACRYALPFLAGQLLHPYYGLGKGGHVTFSWVFLFMVYARVVTQVLVRGLRLPRWAPAALSLAVHFGCFPSASSSFPADSSSASACPAPFARGFTKPAGPLPVFLNCPRFSVCVRVRSHFVSAISTPVCACACACDVRPYCTRESKLNRI